MFAEICRLLDNNNPPTNPLHRQSAGKVERFNRPLVEMLRGKIQQDQTDWDLQLPTCTMAYRAAVYESTGVSLGRELEVPLDVITERPDE